jgi:hypothetical protein
VPRGDPPTRFPRKAARRTEVNDSVQVLQDNVDRLKDAYDKHGPHGQVTSGGGTSFVSAMLAIPNLSAWWRMGETIDYSGLTAKGEPYWGDGGASTTGKDDVLLDTSNVPGSPHNLAYRQRGATTSPDLPQRVSDPALPVDDDGAQKLVNTAVQTTFILPGTWDGAIIPGTPAYSGTLLTAACWFKTRPAAPLTGPVIGNSKTNDLGGFPVGAYKGWQIRQDAGVLTFNMDNSVSSPGAILAPNTWYFVAFTYDGTTYRLYVNGGLAGSVVAGAPTGADSFKVGMTTYKSGFQQLAEASPELSVDEVALWSRTLTPAEILSLYTAGTTGGNSPGGQAYTADGIGGTTWAYPTFESRVNGA